MARTLYCWRCKADIPMLDEHEWERLVPHLTHGIRRIQRYRKQHGVSLAEAQLNAFDDALAAYAAMTGFGETNPKALWHHRAALFGPPCCECGKPLRTPRAKLCAECGASVAGRSG